MLVETARLDEATRHARDLAALTRELLTRYQVAVGSLDGVVVALGPGSYTGLRVGVASAQMLALVAGCDLIGVPNAFALAIEAPADVTRVEFVADALKKQLYFQRLIREGGSSWGWSPEAELSVIPREQWLAELTPGTWVGGPEAGSAEGLARIAELGDRTPSPFGLFEVARLGDGIAGETLEPLYARGELRGEIRWM